MTRTSGSRLPLIDYRRVEIDDEAGTVFLARKGMRIHLGGIGKGTRLSVRPRSFARPGSATS